MIGPGSRSILLDRAIIKESNRVPCLWLLWGCPSAVLLGVQTPVLLSSYWLATVLVYSAELEEAHVDQTGCRPLSLLLYFLVHHTAPSLVLILINSIRVFSSDHLTIWGVGWPLASPPAAKPSTLTKAKLPFLPDETLDFLNTSDARHLIFLFDALLVCTAYYAYYAVSKTARQYWRGGVENDFEYVTASFTLRDYFTESMSFAEKWCCPQLTDAWVVSSSPPSLF